MTSELRKNSSASGSDERRMTLFIRELTFNSTRTRVSYCTAAISRLILLLVDRIIHSDDPVDLSSKTHLILSTTN